MFQITFDLFESGLDLSLEFAMAKICENNMGKDVSAKFICISYSKPR